MGPDENEEPLRKIWNRPKPKRNDDEYVSPVGRSGSRDPVPPPRANYPYSSLEECVWGEGVDLPDDYPTITADEVMEIMTSRSPVLCRLLQN